MKVRQRTLLRAAYILALQGGAQDEAADAAKAVDANTDRHI